jgi:hypothetical protein
LPSTALRVLLWGGIAALLAGLLLLTGATASGASEGFRDTRGAFYEDAAEKLRRAGVFRGCDPAGTLLCPNRALTREEMASVLTRALNLPPANRHYFRDVAVDATHAHTINALRAANITYGCGDTGLFCPRQRVTREQLASFLARITDTPTGSSQPFTDVSGTHAQDIADIAAGGLAAGCGPGRFCPKQAVTRGETAVFIARALGLIPRVTPRPADVSAAAWITTCSPPTSRSSTPCAATSSAARACGRRVEVGHEDTKDTKKGKIVDCG